MYEFWCGVILRDVRSAILTTHQNEYIYFLITYANKFPYIDLILLTATDQYFSISQN